jgi:hypothetical protein
VSSCPINRHATHVQAQRQLTDAQGVADNLQDQLLQQGALVKAAHKALAAMEAAADASDAVRRPRGPSKPLLGKDRTASRCRQQPDLQVCPGGGRVQTILVRSRFVNWRASSNTYQATQACRREIQIDPCCHAPCTAAPDGMVCACAVLAAV